MKTRHAAWLLLICTALLADGALAQFGGSGGVFGGRGMPRGGSGRGGESPGARERNPITAPDPTSYEQIDYRLTMLEDDLNLTQAQLGAWKAFAEKTRAYAGDLARERSRNLRTPSPASVPPTALQHIGQAVDGARNRLTALEEVEAAMRVLYPLLAPAQKTMADMRVPTIIAPRPVVGPGRDTQGPPDLSGEGRGR